MRVENWPLMETVIRRIKADPNSWYQGAWACEVPECGTSYCIAGHAIVESGYEFYRPEKDARLNEHYVVVPDGSALRHLAAEMTVGPYSIVPKVPLASPAAAGRELFGLGPGDALMLFDANNSFPEILAMIEDFAADDGYDWPAELRLTPEQRAIVDNFDAEDFNGDEGALADLERELLYPEAVSSL